MTEAKKKQFTKLKEMHPDTLLLFRCGNFYESYQEDAESASRILGITLTRDKAGDRQAFLNDCNPTSAAPMTALLFDYVLSQDLAEEVQL